MMSICEANNPVLPDWTIVAPWVSATDWTSVMIRYFQRILKPKKTGLVWGRSVQQHDYGWLSSKLDTNNRLLIARATNRLGRNLLLLDTQYVDLHAARTLIGDSGKIVMLLNGGVFQENDLECQNLRKQRSKLLRFEGGHFNLCDRIVVPTNYAAQLLTRAYPFLRSKVSIVPYPLRMPDAHAPPIIQKQGIGFFGRQSFEKGWDIVQHLKSQIDDLAISTSSRPVRGRSYHASLSRCRAVLVPSRADLYGCIALESLLCGSIPIVPKGLSYDELVDIPEQYKFPKLTETCLLEPLVEVCRKVLSLDIEEYILILCRAQRHVQAILGAQDTHFQDIFNEVGSSGN